MAYFQMDDGFETDKRVLRAGRAAFGLYASCGIWVARTLTDGFVSAEIATLYGTREWIEKLTANGLWTPVEDGFDMPDYLTTHKNPTAEVVRKRRADAAARKQKQRDGRRPPKASQGESRGTHSGTHGETHASLSAPPPKGGEEGDAPLRGGGAPPSTTTTHSGHDICATHHQELPCISCRADAVAGNDLDLDQRPPVPQDTAKQPRASPKSTDEPSVSQQILTERAVAAGWLAGRPDVKRHIDAAVDQLLAAGHEVPVAEDIAELAAELHARAAALAAGPATDANPTGAA